MNGQHRRVAITGLGAICGLGHDVKSVWDNALNGRSGISTIENSDTSKLAVNIAGEVKNFTVANELLPEREAPRYDRFIHYSLKAASEAMDDSKLSHPLNNEDRFSYPRERMGIVMGVGIGGFHHMEEYKMIMEEKGVRRVSPFLIPSIIPNMGAGMTSIRLDLKGINYSIASACASSCHAAVTAAYEIMLGRHDVVVCGGAEGVLSPLAIAGFQVMKALSKRNEEPTKASRPFDSARDGFVMGEGAGFMVFEDLEKAKARGAKIYAELVGFGSSSDAEHITAPHPEGVGALQCMNQALATAEISPQQIDYVNAHGTSTPLGDIAETKALKKAFGDHAYNLSVSSTKSMTGHLLGAAGGLESLFCIKALEEGKIPPTINLENPDPECDLDYTPNKMKEKQIEYALNNSFGFGGTNCTLIFKKYTD